MSNIFTTSHKSLQAGYDLRQWAIISLSILAGIVLAAILDLSPYLLFIACSLPAFLSVFSIEKLAGKYWISRGRKREADLDGGESIEGDPPQRDALSLEIETRALADDLMLNRYLIGFDLKTGTGIWLTNEEICQHLCLLDNLPVHTSNCFENLVLQQLARGRAGGLTFIDGRSDSQTLEKLVVLAIKTGRQEDLIIIDPVNPLHNYNFIANVESTDVKATKILKAIYKEPINTEKRQLVSDLIYRIVRALDATGLAWTIKDIVSLICRPSLVLPDLKNLLERKEAKSILLELEQIFAEQSNTRSSLESESASDLLKTIAKELAILSEGPFAESFKVTDSDLLLGEAISRGKIIYIKLPEQQRGSESATIWNRILKDDLELAIKGVNSSKANLLEDPHLIFIDDGFTDTQIDWTLLIEAARSTNVALLYRVTPEQNLKSFTDKLLKQPITRIFSRVKTKLFLGCRNEEQFETLNKLTSFRMPGLQKSSQSSEKSRIDESRELQQEEALESLFDEELDVSSTADLEAHSPAMRKVAWFDFGNEIIIKGSYLSVEISLPENWRPREFVVKLNKIPPEEVYFLKALG